MRMRFYKLVLGVNVAIGPCVGCAAAQAVDDAPAGPESDPSVQVMPETEATPQTIELLQRIESASAEVDTLKCRVRYTRTQGLFGDQQRRFGDFYYRAPTDETPTGFSVRFDRLVIDERARTMETWFIFDGNWLLERDHIDKTATRRELVPAGSERSDTLSFGDGQMPIPLRLDADEVLATYRVARLEDQPFGERTLAHLRLSPKQADSTVEPMDLWFDLETLHLHKVVTAEGEGETKDTIELVFSLIKIDPEVKPGTFETSLPDPDAGWQVQEVPIAG